MSTNLVVISGRIGNEVILKEFSDGSKVCNINLAVSAYFNQGGARVEQTTWVQCAVWGAMAQNVAQFKRKGDFIIVTGTLEAPRAYLDKAGKPQAQAAVRATSVDFGPKTSQGESQGGPSEAEIYQQQQVAVTPDGELPPQ